MYVFLLVNLRVFKDAHFEFVVLILAGFAPFQIRLLLNQQISHKSSVLRLTDRHPTIFHLENRRMSVCQPVNRRKLWCIFSLFLQIWMCGTNLAHIYLCGWVYWSILELPKMFTATFLFKIKLNWVCLTINLTNKIVLICCIAMSGVSKKLQISNMNIDYMCRKKGS